MTHEVNVLCNCPDVEHCRMELYMSDVRIAYMELERLRLERDCLSGYVSGIEGRGVPAERYFTLRVADA